MGLDQAQFPRTPLYPTLQMRDCVTLLSRGSTWQIGLLPLFPLQSPLFSMKPSSINPISPTLQTPFLLQIPAQHRPFHTHMPGLQPRIHTAESHSSVGARRESGSHYTSPLHGPV